MIRAMIFDLDGTLLKTERLKAISYARAAMELSPGGIREEDVLEAFQEVVGLSREEVAGFLLRRFGLEESVRSRMRGLRVATPWEAFAALRAPIYEKMLEDPEVLRKEQWPGNVALLTDARRTGCRVGLATMSHRPQVRRVLELLGWSGLFDYIATRDDVGRGKPDPEIYLLVARGLRVPPPDCLVVEDSPAGVKAALAARMWCIAVTTPFTREGIHAGRLLEDRWIVDDPSALPSVVRRMIEERKEGGSEPK
ncbi:MAG: beta-phosphoglucomutase [Deltaproteobacteria bacterium]